MEKKNNEPNSVGTEFQVIIRIILNQGTVSVEVIVLPCADNPKNTYLRG